MYGRKFATKPAKRKFAPSARDLMGGRGHGRVNPHLPIGSRMAQLPWWKMINAKKKK